MAVIKVNNMTTSIKPIIGQAKSWDNETTKLKPIPKFTKPNDVNLIDIQNKARTPIFNNVTTERTYTPTSIVTGKQIGRAHV